MKIIVTGSSGQVGSEIRSLSANHPDHKFIFCDKNDMDLSSSEAIEKYLTEKEFDLIINCGAYTQVDQAEDEPDLARKINADAPKTIASVCKQKNARLIHISTDYVFNGRHYRPITEEDIPNPDSVYGQTKLEGEQGVIATLPASYVIRTSWVYSTFGSNFVKTMIRLSKERDKLTIVSDQVGTPTYARHLADTILTIAEKIDTEDDKPGIYHFSNEGACSWYDFAYTIMQETGKNCLITPILSADFPTKATRPFYSVLDKSKIKQTFDITIPHWTKGLQSYLETDNG